MKHSFYTLIVIFAVLLLSGLVITRHSDSAEMYKPLTEASAMKLNFIITDAIGYCMKIIGFFGLIPSDIGATFSRLAENQ